MTQTEQNVQGNMERKIATPPATRNMLSKESVWLRKYPRLLTTSKEKPTKTKVKLQTKLVRIGSQPH